MGKLLLVLIVTIVLVAVVVGGLSSLMQSPVAVQAQQSGETQRQMLSLMGEQQARINENSHVFEELYQAERQMRLIEQQAHTERAMMAVGIIVVLLLIGIPFLAVVLGAVALFYRRRQMQDELLLLEGRRQYIPGHTPVRLPQRDDWRAR